MLKKPNKNPTFNEYFPQKATDDSVDLMFDHVFNSNLAVKIIDLFATGYPENFKLSFEIGFRILHGEQQVDNTIINNPLTNIFPPNDK